MQAMIEEGDQLITWFFEVSRSHGGNDKLRQGICVTSAVRRDILTGERQGRLLLGGNIQTVQFDNLGGGVHRAYLCMESEADDA